MVSHLLEAVRAEDLEEVKRLLSKDGSFISTRLNSSFFIASTEGHFAIARELLNAGANPNDTDGSGQTPFSFAAQTGKHHFFPDLLEMGADINKADNAGATPLMSAAQSDKLDTVKELLSLGANYHATDKTGKTAVDYAMKWNHQPIAAYIQSFIVSQYEKTNFDETIKDAPSSPPANNRL